ncbi:MAG TPA: hypothetical protein VMJ35_06925 [Dongiaceae bacterium]|nr:hypothetical protein [Dongiaceae bacterium]
MDPDDRLVAAVGGAARYLADAAGLSNEMILQFQESVVSACRHCFHCHSAETQCGITLRRSMDRLDVEVALPGTKPPEGEKPSWAGIDEVHCESRDHEAVLRLTKFVSPNPPAD